MPVGPHDWDSIEDDGPRSRGHDADGGDWPSVPSGDGYNRASVSAWALEVQGARRAGDGPP